MSRRRKQIAQVETHRPLAIVPSIGGGDAARLRVQQEYIAPHTANPLANQLPAEQYEPNAPEITFATYRQMMKDPAVSSAVKTLVRHVLADGMQLAPSFNEMQVAEGQPEYAKAVEIADFVRRAMSATTKPLAKTLGQLLEGALTFGHKVAEVTWKLGTGPDAGKLVVGRVACKPHELLDFVLDEFANHVGFVPRLSNAKLPPGSRILPREKFAVLTLNEENEDPRGNSALRCVYTPWNFKALGWPEYLRWLQNTAQASIIGVLPEKKAGEIARGGAPKPDEKSEAEKLLDTLLGIKNASAAVVKNGTEVVQVEASPSEGFETALAVADSQISRGIMGQTLATSEAQFGTRAQSETHMSILDLLVAWLKEELASCVTADFVRKAVAYNYGEEMLAYCPQVSFGDSDRRDWSKDANAASMLEPSVTDSQWNQITTQLGLEPPLPGERPRREAGKTESSAPGALPAGTGVALAAAIRRRTGAFITLRRAA